MTGLLRTLVLLGALSSGVASAVEADQAAADAPLDKSFWSWMTLDAAGRVTAVEVDAGASESVAAVIEGLANQLEFAPARVAGIAVPSVVPVGLTVRFTSDTAGNYSAALRSAKVHTLRAEALSPSRYPSKELRAGVGGWALVGFVVAGDAGVDPTSVQVLDQGAFEHRRLLGAGHASAKSFAAATAAAAGEWSFRTARVDGVPLSVRMATPMTFRPGSGSQGEPGELPDFVKAAQQPVPEPVLLDTEIVLPMLASALPGSPPASEAGTIEVTGTRVRRATISFP